MKNKNVTAEISVSIPILKNLPDSGLSLNLGALTLSLEGRNFILDSTYTNYKNGQKKGKKFTFDSQLEVDFEVFEEDEDYNYQLTEDDLKNKNLKAEFYCGDEDTGVENGFDFDNAEIELTVTVDGKAYQIKNVTFE